MIHYFIPYSTDKNLAEAYNYYCSLVPNDTDWICILDGDTLFLNNNWGHILEVYIKKYPDTAMFSCIVNRTGTNPQKYRGLISEETNILHHKKIANLVRKTGYRAERVNQPLAGHLMLFRKNVWDKIKFKGSGLLGIDYTYTRDLIRAGYKVRVMKSFYMFHLWRLGDGGVSEKTHLRLKKAIYTCITGNYDKLKDPIVRTNKVDFVCFTDNPNLKSKIWKIKYLPNKYNLDPIRLARRVKILSHEYMNKYDLTIWVDANYQISLISNKFINSIIGLNNCVLMKHAKRDCIYEEGDACISMNKGVEEEIRDQIAEYADKGVPANYGLYDTSVLIRKKSFAPYNDQWWNEVKNKSTRDQLSLPYVLWLNRDNNEMKIKMLLRKKITNKRLKRTGHAKKI